MPETLPEPIELAARSVEEFVAQESDLLRLDVHEQALTHKLAEYVQRQFPGWNVDCEYNRRAQAIKRIRRATPEGGEDEIEIKPDIIVHKREKRENLLLIEAKKSTNKELKNDEDKLEGLTDKNGEYGYDFGLHLILDCRARRVADVIVYVSGEVDEAMTEKARTRLAL